MTSKIYFCIKCEQTKLGQTVSIVGSILELGFWDPEKAISFTTNQEQFPNWYLEIQLPQKTIIEYKFIICSDSSEQTSNSVVWEDIGLTNRFMRTKDRKEIFVNIQFNKFESKEYTHEQLLQKQYAHIFPEQIQKQTQIRSSFGQLNKLNYFNEKTKDFTCSQTSFSDLAVQQQVGQIYQNQTSESSLNFNSQQSFLKQSTEKKQNQSKKKSNSPKSLVGKKNSMRNLNIERQINSADFKNQIETEQLSDNQSNLFQKQIQNDKTTLTDFKNIKIISQKTQGYPTNLNLKNQMSNAFELPSGMNFDASPISGTQEPASNIQINLNEPVIMASFLLPYQIQRDARSGKLSIHTSLHNPTIMYGTLESMIQKKQINLKWVGLVTTPCELSEVEKDQLYLQFQKKGAYPIFMTAEETAPFLIFYENHIRLLFHNFKDLNNINNHTSKHWDSYVELNQKFAKEILAVRAKLKNVPKQIFIHNNHLLMVPALVRKQFQEANIGLFFHSPFPNSSHFQTAKFRFEMLKSLLHCDLICFNLFIHAKNFIRSVQKLFGFELEFYPEGYFGIDFHGKKVLIRVSHVGIDQNFIQELTKSRMFKAHQISFNNALQKHLMQIKENNNLNTNKKQFSQNERPIIMSSIDSYHPMSGLKNKLLSYKLFLQRYPNYRNRVVLIQFVGSILQTYSFVQNIKKQHFLIKKMRNDVIQLRDEIHKEFGQGCLIFQESNPPLEKRLVLWTQSNIILCSALKDGLCIQLLEYVVCRNLINKFSQSAMICSEFAGCSEAMKGVMMFNPFSLTDFHEILDQAISQTPETNEEQMKIAYSYVCRNSMTKWTINFLKDLKYGYQPTMASYYLGLNLNPRQGKAFNKIKMRSDFKKLNIDACSNSLVKAKKSVIIIEIEAMPTRKFSKNSIPRTEVIEQLHNIMNDNRNIVVIIGNQTQQTLEDWFIKCRPCGINGNHFWLAAESGYLYKTGASVGGQWQQQTELLDVSWMQKVRKIMSGFQENIDGSFIEERQSQILWNYKFADPEQSMLFIHDLYNQINIIAEQEQIQIIQGCGYLEVKPVTIQKQKLIQILMKSIVKNSKIDFIFYLGSSSEDEIVFEYLKSEQANNLFFSQDCAKYICVLEKKPSEADYFLEDRDQVRPLLAKLQTATQQRKKNRSYADLTKLTYNLGSLNSFKLRNMNQSIANLNQYVHANTNVTQLDVMNPSFYLNKFKKRRQSIEVRPGIIEEQYNNQLQQNEMLKETKKKFASLGDTTEQQNATKITSQVQEKKLISDRHLVSSELVLQINLGQVPSKNHSMDEKRQAESDKEVDIQTPKNQDQDKEIFFRFEKSPLHQNYENSPKGDQARTIQFNFSNHSFEARNKLKINHLQTVSGQKEESSIQFDEEFFYNQDQGNQQILIVENSEEILGSEFESFAKESFSINLKSQKVKQFNIRKFALKNLNIQMPFDNNSFTKSLKIDHKKTKEASSFIPHNHSTIGLVRQEPRIITPSIFKQLTSKTQNIPFGAHSTNELFTSQQKLDYIKKNHEITSFNLDKNLIQEKKEQNSSNQSSMSDCVSFSMSSCEASIIRCQSINEPNPRKLKISISCNQQTFQGNLANRIRGDKPFLVKQVSKKSDTYGLGKSGFRANKSGIFGGLKEDACVSWGGEFKNHLMNEEDSIYCGSELKGNEIMFKKQEQSQSARLHSNNPSSSIDYLLIRKLSQIPKNKQRINLGLDQKDIEYDGLDLEQSEGSNLNIE